MKFIDICAQIAAHRCVTSRVTKVQKWIAATGIPIRSGRLLTFKGMKK